MSKEKDPLYEKVKKEVDLRDKRCCQFSRCLSIKESYQFIDGSPKTLDRCHIFSRSSHQKLIYIKNNIISLQRFIHRRMDDYKNPLTNENIDINKHFYWWWRIKNHCIEDYDEEIDYEEILMKEIR